MRNCDVEFSTIVEGDSLPDAIIKVRKNIKKYKWKTTISEHNDCWSAETLPPKGENERTNR